MSKYVYEIHYTLKDGSEDHVVLRAGTISRLMELAEQHLARVGGKDPWSKEIKSTDE